MATTERPTDKGDHWETIATGTCRFQLRPSSCDTTKDTHYVKLLWFGRSRSRRRSGSPRRPVKLNEVYFRDWTIIYLLISDFGGFLCGWWGVIKINHFAQIIMCLLLYTEGEIRFNSISLRVSRCSSLPLLLLAARFVKHLSYSTRKKHKKHIEVQF